MLVQRGSLRQFTAVEDFLTVSETAREAGVQRSTVQRWLKANRLHKQANGMLLWDDVQRCLDEPRTGRPYGRAPGKWAIFLSEAREGYARPFLEPGKKGLVRLKAALEEVAHAYVAADRSDHLVNLLLTMAVDVDRMKSKKSKFTSASTTELQNG